MQSHHEPLKITSRASRFAEWPPSQSKSTRLCLTLHHIASTTLTPSLAFFSPITNIWLLHPQKAFFSKNLKMIKIFFREDHRYHVLRFTLITFINLIPRKYKSVNLNSCVIRFIHLLILVCWLYQGYLLSNTEI